RVQLFDGGRKIITLPRSCKQVPGEKAARPGTHRVIMLVGQQAEINYPRRLSKGGRWFGSLPVAQGQIDDIRCPLTPGDRFLFHSHSPCYSCKFNPRASNALTDCPS